MKCKNCGARVKKGETSCPHCGAEIEEPGTVSCPQCGERMPQEEEFCPACGARNEEVQRILEQQKEATRKIKKICIILLVLNLIVLAGHVYFKPFRDWGENFTRKVYTHVLAGKHRATLAQYEAAGDYDRMAEYYRINWLEKENVAPEYNAVCHLASAYRFVVDTIFEYQYDQHTPIKAVGKVTDHGKYLYSISAGLKNFIYYRNTILSRDGDADEAHLAAAEEMTARIRLLLNDFCGMTEAELEALPGMDNIEIMKRMGTGLGIPESELLPLLRSTLLGNPFGNKETEPASNELAD